MIAARNLRLAREQLMSNFTMGEMMIGFSFYKTLRASLKVKHGPSVALDAHFDRANCTSAAIDRPTLYLILVQFRQHILVQFHPRSSLSLSLLRKALSFLRSEQKAKKSYLPFACIAPFSLSKMVACLCDLHLHLHA
jgi:hypothetical protein